MYKELKRRGYSIPKDKLIQYMDETGKINAKSEQAEEDMQVRERHSFSLVHGDFRRRTDADHYAIVWLDDVSRMILSCGEFS